MSARCRAIAVLRGTIRAIDWVTSIKIDETVAVGFAITATIWVISTLIVADGANVHWALAALALPAAIAAIVGLILLCCWLRVCYDRLRDWTERAYRECQKAQPPTPPSTP